MEATYGIMNEDNIYLRYIVVEINKRLNSI